jgi:Fascin domain
MSTQVVIRSKRIGTWKAGHPALCAEPSGKVVCNRFGRANDWERWTMETSGDAVAFKSHHGKYLSASPDGRVFNTESVVDSWELWTFVDFGDGVAIKSAHGRYLTVEGGEIAGWGEGDWVSANPEEAKLWEMFMIVFDDHAFTNTPPEA